MVGLGGFERKVGDPLGLSPTELLTPASELGSVEVAVRLRPLPSFAFAEREAVSSV